MSHQALDSKAEWCCPELQVTGTFAVRHVQLRYQRCRGVKRVQLSSLYTCLVLGGQAHVLGARGRWR